MGNRPTLSSAGADLSVGQFRIARVSVSLIFLIHGILISSWMARIPAVKEKLGIPLGTLGALLLSAAAGALVSMPLTSRLVGRFGSARMTQVTTAILCFVIALPALAGSAVTLAICLFVYGAAAGAMDVSMNTQAVEVEAVMGRPVMVGFHALFSFGGMIGALVGSAAAKWGIEPSVNLGGTGLALLLLAAVVVWQLIPDRHIHAAETGGFRNLVLPLAGLAVVAFCILLGEGAMADWSAVYLSQLADLARAPLGYAVFSLMMAMGRLSGDWFHAHLGAAATVRWGSALATVGLVGGLIAGTTASALVGFACVGFGFSAVFPIVCSVAGANAGNRPQQGIAAVSMTGYLGFLVGPPLIGFLAQAYSLRLALGLVAVMSGLTASMAGIVHPRRRQREN
jgi:MFS family permease